MTTMDPAELKARAEANLQSPEGEKQFLQDYYAKKLAAFEATNPSAADLEQYHANVAKTLDHIKPLYEAIERNNAKMQEKFPDAKIPLPVWTDQIPEGDVAHYIEENGTKTILLHPNVLTMAPELAAAVNSHEGGHAVYHAYYPDATDAAKNQEECFADRAVKFSDPEIADNLRKAFAYMAYKEMSIDKQNGVERDVGFADVTAPHHLTVRERDAMLIDDELKGVSPLNLKFDEACRVSLKAAPPPPKKQTPRQK